MQPNSTEISELIKQRIAQFNVVSEAHNEGTIVSVSDGVIRIHGLADCMQGEMISLPGNRYAIALNLERDSVGAVVMGPYADLAEGMKVKCTGRILEFRLAVACWAVWLTLWVHQSTVKVRWITTASLL
ncbi:hypothetical protein ACVXG8_07515 [Escherichia coli]